MIEKVCLSGLLGEGGFINFLIETPGKFMKDEIPPPTTSQMNSCKCVEIKMQLLMKVVSMKEMMILLFTTQTLLISKEESHSL